MGSYTLRKEDVVESFVRSSGPGGQNVNKVSTCVELVHEPTGIRIKCQKYRTQAQNREEAWSDYLRLCKAGGSESFLKVLKVANLSMVKFLKPIDYQAFSKLIRLKIYNK